MDVSIFSNKSVDDINHQGAHQGVSLETRLTLIWLFVGLSVIGMMGNSCSIFLLSGKKQKRKKILSDAYRIYIIALALADNGMLFFTGILRYSLVAWMYETGHPSITYEVYLCRWHRFFMHASHNAAVWLLVVMATDRFVAVCFPFHYREVKQNSKKATKVTTVVCILSFLFASPFLAVGPLYGNHEEHRKIPKISEQQPHFFNSTITLPFGESTSSRHPETEPNNTDKLTASISMDSFEKFENSAMASTVSIPMTDGHLAFPSQRVISGCTLTATIGDYYAFVVNIIFHILLAFLIPYFVLILLNLVIFRSLHRSRSSTQLSGARQRLHRRITIMMLAVCCTFIILWLPQTLLLLTSSDAHSHKCNENEIFASLAALSGLANSALNFFLYCMTVKKFRHEALLTIQRFCCLISVKQTLSEFPSANSIKRHNSSRPNNGRNSNATLTPLAKFTLKSSSSKTPRPHLDAIPEITALSQRDEDVTCKEECWQN